MTARRTTRAFRWQLRRALLGLALVLHLGWLALGAMPAAAAPSATAAMPCHTSLHGVMHESPHPASQATHGGSGSHQRHAPADSSHLPCCSYGCACAAGLCLITAASAQPRAELVRHHLPNATFALPASRSPTPELRPPIAT